MLCSIRRAVRAVYVDRSLVSARASSRPRPRRRRRCRAALVGNVTDQSGLAMPGATVTITETEHEHQLQHGDQRSRLLHVPQLEGRHLPGGRRSWPASRRSCATASSSPVNTTIRVDLQDGGRRPRGVDHRRRLRARMLQTDRSDTGRLIESKMVTDMPLTFNRNFQSLLVTVPGATRPHREHSAFFNSQDSLADRSQRPVAPREQHDDRGRRQQPEDRPAPGDHPGGRRARDRQRDDEQLRRGVRPLGRRGHQRDAQVRHQHAEGQRLLLRQHREDQRRATTSRT